MEEKNENFSSMIAKIDAIYISDSFFEMINAQSCDCDELIIKRGDKYVRLISEAVGKDGRVVFDVVSSVDEVQYPYEVRLDKAQFVFDKFSHLENGAIDGIRFVSDGVFLFVFALEHNLVLTMSKYDLFDEAETDFPKEEAELLIKRAK